jgi:stage II sporulation protein AA (anti-sigma F factor antagonist)
MEIRQRKEKDAVVVSIKGRLDASSSPQFEKELAAVMDEGERLLVVDFGELEYISSAGLRSILATTKKLKEKGGKLLLCALKDVVKEVFEISGFSSIIPIYGSIESALER